jgi:hypothetical protein
MIWTYRLCRDEQGRCSIREVFYERDNTIIAYSKAPVTLVGDSIEELMQLVQWFREAFELPVLVLEEVDAQIGMQPKKQQADNSRNMSLQQVISQLASETDSVSSPDS